MLLFKCSIIDDCDLFRGLVDHQALLTDSGENKTLVALHLVIEVSLNDAFEFICISGEHHLRNTLKSKIH